MLLPRPLHALAAITAAVALLACGEGATLPTPAENGDEPETPTVPAVPTTAEVHMLSTGDGYGELIHDFSPPTVTIQEGGSITWVNSTGHPHNVTFAAASGAPDDVANFSDGLATRSFAASGTFSYQCTNHAGMSGQVVVAAP